MKKKELSVEYEELLELFEELKKKELPYQKSKIIERKIKEVKSNKNLYESVNRSSSMLGGRLKEKYEKSITDALLLIDAALEAPAPVKQEVKTVKVRRTSNDLVSKREAKFVTDLILSSKKYDEIPDLANYKKLIMLRLWANNITEIENLDNLVTLEELYLGSNKIKEINGLHNLENLKVIYFVSNDISELKGVSHLKNLEQLELAKNKIKKIEGLNDLLELETLDISENEIEEIENLESVIYLDTLCLNGNKIKEIKGLDTLFVLRKLNLSYNQISELKGLDKLETLEMLRINNNEISEIKGIHGSPLLVELSLSNNKIKEIKGLHDVPELQHLNLSGNQISEIKGLEKLKNLRKLNLSDNNIKEVGNLDYLESLVEIDVRYNPIKDTDYLDRIHKERGIRVHYSEYKPEESEASSVIAQSTKKLELYKSLDDDIEKILKEKKEASEAEKLNLEEDYKEVMTIFEDLKKYWARREGNGIISEQGAEIDKKLKDLMLSKDTHSFYVSKDTFDEEYAAELKGKYDKHVADLKELMMSYLSELSG